MTSKASARPGASLDQEIVGLFIALMESFKEHFAATLAAVDLSMSHGHVLMTVEEPTPMSVLAKRTCFDASHITAIVDRLEERELIERRPDPHDRRIKRVALTAGGELLRCQIRDELLNRLSPLTRLTKAQRVQLRDLLVIVNGAPPTP